MTDTFGVLRLPDHVHVGRGARRGLIPAVASFGTRAFIVVDPFIATTPEFLAARDGLVSDGVEVVVHSAVVPELPLDSIDAATAAARQMSPEVIVGFGGGSALDLAKLVALSLTHRGPLSAYYGENRVPGPVVPVIAVPTTAGTGSEVTPVAVVSDPDRELKVGVSSPFLIPRFALVDPELAFGAPERVTAYSGIDALAHAIESFTAVEREPDWSKQLPVFVGRNRLSSLLGFEAIREIGTSLTRAVAGADLRAHESMSWGSVFAGMAFGSAGTHLSHALQYPIGALTKTPHGLGTGMMLPYVMQACLPTAMAATARVGDALGARGATEAFRAQAAVDRVACIVAEIGIPQSLAELGVEADQLPRIAELALGVTRLVQNSTQDATIGLLERILAAAFAGDRRLLA